MTPLAGGKITSVPVRFVNPQPIDVEIHKGSRVAMVEQLDVAAIITVSEEPAHVPRHYN